jgi:D-alanine-D-alanine ligase
MIHGDPGENGILQSYFELIGLPYATSGVLASNMGFNKYHCKAILEKFDILTPKSVLIREDVPLQSVNIIEKLGLPCFVKPNAGGSSFGVSKIEHVRQLKESIEKALTESREVICEEFIEGTEVTCGLCKTKKSEYVFPITEIVSKNTFFDYEAKYDPNYSDEITPARISEDIEFETKSVSSKIYDILDCKGIVRIDFIIKDKKPYFLEINTVPGMSENSIIHKQVREMGL